MLGICRLGLLFLEKKGRAAELGTLSYTIKTFLEVGGGTHGKIKRLEESLRDMKEEAKLKEKEMAEIAANLEFTRREKESLAETIEQLNLTIIEMRDEFEEVSRMKEKELEKNFSADLKTKELRVNKLEEQLAEARGANSSLKNRLEGERTAKEALEKEIAGLKSQSEVKVDRSRLEETQRLFEESRKSTRDLSSQISASRIEIEELRHSYELKLAEANAAAKKLNASAKQEAERLASEILKWKTIAENHNKPNSNLHISEDFELTALTDIHCLDENDFSVMACENCKKLEKDLAHSNELLTRTDKLLEESRERLSAAQKELVAAREEAQELKVQARSVEEFRFKENSDRVMNKSMRVEKTKKPGPETGFATEMVSKVLSLEAEVKKLKLKCQMAAKDLETSEARAASERFMIYSLVSAYAKNN